jgi:hypothetical protein
MSLPLITRARREADTAAIIVGARQCLPVGGRAPRFLGRAAASISNTQGQRPRAKDGRGNRCGRTANETAARMCVQIESRL